MPRKKINKIALIPDESAYPSSLNRWPIEGREPDKMWGLTWYQKRLNLTNGLVTELNNEIEKHNHDIDLGQIGGYIRYISKPDDKPNPPNFAYYWNRGVKEWAKPYVDIFNAKLDELIAASSVMDKNESIYKQEKLEKELKKKKELDEIKHVVAQNTADIRNLINTEIKNNRDFFSEQLSLIKDEDTKTIAEINEQLMNATQENIALQKSVDTRMEEFAKRNAEADKKLDAYNKKVDKLEGLYNASANDLRFSQTQDKIKSIKLDLFTLDKDVDKLKKLYKKANKQNDTITVDFGNLSKDVDKLKKAFDEDRKEREDEISNADDLFDEHQHYIWNLEKAQKDIQRRQNLQKAISVGLGKKTVINEKALEEEKANNLKKYNELIEKVKLHQQHNKTQFDLFEKSFNNANDSIDILGKKVESAQKTGEKLGADFLFLKENLAANKKETEDVNRRLKKQGDEANVNFKELFSRNEYIRRAVVGQGKKMRSTLGKETQKAFKDRAYALQFVRRGRNALLFEEVY